MKRTDIWMPFYVGDYLADTQHLSTVEHGAYILLLLAYWNNRGPLEGNDSRLASIARMSLGEWMSVRPIIVKFFRITDTLGVSLTDTVSVSVTDTVSDTLWNHKRVDEELRKSISNSDARRNGAKKTNFKLGRTVTDTVSDTPSDTVNDPQSQSPSHIVLKSTVQSTGRRPETFTVFSAFCTSLGIIATDVRYLWNNWEENGWTRGGRPIRDWQQCVRVWQDGGFLPSQKGGVRPKQSFVPGSGNF